MMERGNLPELNIHVAKHVKIKKTNSGLLMTYSLRPFLPWIFLSISTLFTLMLFFAGAGLSLLLITIICSYLTSTIPFQPRAFDKCQLEFNSREVVCKRGFLFPKVTVFRRYHKDNLNIGFEIEYGSSKYGKIEHYCAFICDSYDIFKIYCKTRELSLALVSDLKKCDEWSKKNPVVNEA